jgi:uncharacterized membrane protein YbaN (DUF454 family)
MNVKRLVYALVGGVVLLIGIALLVLPGPGLILVVAGLATLARAFPRLERHLAPVRARARKVAEESVRSPWRLAGSILTGLALVAAGVVWGLESDLPFDGWPTGASLIVSGLVLFALLAYSFRQAHGRRDE